jgi:hypothetical protein
MEFVVVHSDSKGVAQQRAVTSLVGDLHVGAGVLHHEDEVGELRRGCTKNELLPSRGTTKSKMNGNHTPRIQRSEQMTHTAEAPCRYSENGDERESTSSRGHTSDVCRL